MGVFFKPEPQSQQEQHRQGDVDHVPLPPCPAAVLVVIHAEVLLAVLEALLDGPSADQRIPASLLGHMR